VTAPQQLVERSRGRSVRSRRLMVLITSLQYGGADSQVVALTLGLKDRGWDVAVVCMVAPTAFADVLQAAGVPVHSLDMPRGIPDPRGMRRLAALVRAFRPDVLHSHMVHANLLARVTRLFARMPVLVCTAHNLREESEKGGPTWHKELLYRWTDGLADETTIISRAAFDRYVAVGAVPRHKFSVVPNGIDTSRFAPSAEARKRARKELGFADEFVWMAVGRMVVQKDYPNLLRAFARIESPKSSLMIAGRGPLQAELEALSASLGVRDRVRFVGVRPDLAAWYNAADAFVNSSVFEGLSAALLEAAATALPAVVTDVGGNGEIYLHNASGYLVPPSDSTALAAAMQRLMLLGDAERGQLGEAARDYCLKTYALETVISRWETLYAQLESRRTQPPPSGVGAIHSAARKSPEIAPANDLYDRRLKVFYVVTRAERGGAQVHVNDLMQGMGDRIQAALVTGEVGYLYEEASRAGIPVHRLRRLIRPVRPLTDLRAVVDLAKLIRDEKPDLIHAHTSKAGLVSRLAALLTRTPVLFTAHTWSFREGTSAVQDKISVVVEKVLARLGGRIILVSESNRNIALRNHVGTERQLSTVWNGIPDVPWQAKHGASSVPRIVMVARFVRQKDHETLIRALAEVRIPWVLSLLGDGPLLEPIKILAEQLGIRDPIDFAGACETVPQFLAECDLFVLSSKHEGLPISILEAMRAGLPVIATDTGGVPESVTGGVTGYLVECQNVKELRARITDLLGDAELRARMGRAGRERFLRDFQLESMVSKTLDIYQLVGKKQTCPRGAISQ